MAIIPVSDLGAGGLVSDMPLYDQPPNLFSAVINARPHHRGMQSVWNYRVATGFQVITGAIALDYFEKNDIRYWVSASLTTVYLHDGNTGVNLDASFAATFRTRWQFSSFQGLLVYNNGVDIPQFWDTTSFAANAGAALTNWPATSRCRVLRSFKQFLIALYITDSGTVYHSRVAWGAPAEPGQLPSTWDPADDTEDAGWFDIADTPGPLIDCLALGDANILYKSDSTWGMVYTANEQVFRFYRISNFGILSQNCVVEVPDGHIVLGNGDVFLNTGQGTPRSLVNKKIRDAIYSRINTNNSDFAFLCLQPQFEECWICIPSLTKDPTDDLYLCDLAYTINYRTGAIGSRELPNVSAASNGFTTRSLTQIIYSTATLAYSAYGPATYNQQVAGEEDTQALAMCSRPLAPSLLVLDEYDANVGALNMTLTREAWAIVGQDRQGQWIVDTTSYKLITAIWPVLECNPSADFTITISVGNQPYFRGPIAWEDYDYAREDYSLDGSIVPNDPADIAPAVTTALRADFIVNSVLPAVKFQVNFRNAFSKVLLTGYSVDVKPAGRVLRSG